MQKTVTLLLFFIFISQNLIFSQQVTTIQSFIYSSTTRDTVVEFPNLDHNEYEKILMVYSMRCKDGLVSPAIAGQTNIGCGEWDYSCNTYITDSTRVDSLFAYAPSHVISNFTGTTFEYSIDPTYQYYQSSQQAVVYDNVISENEIPFGNGITPNEIPFGGDQRIARSQLLYPSDALIGLGLTAGNITGLKLDTDVAAAGFDKLKIRMKSTAKSELAAATIDNDGFTEVYYLNTDMSAGANFFKFHTPFDWDGSSNIIIDLSYTREGTASATVNTAPQTGIASLTANGDHDKSIEFNGAGYVKIDQPISSIQNEITISFWSKGDDVLPVNTTVVGGDDADGNRQISVHLPWNNGQIYWDCGNDGSNYDRINKVAAANQFKNKWNHMAFTKNATTGQMKIYINGSLWHTGGGKTKPIDLQKYNIGNNSIGSGAYFGKIDDFQIWDKELSEATIKAWMTKAVTPDHPNYDHLVANYTFDNDNGLTVIDDSPNAITATTEGLLAYRTYEGNELVKNITASVDLANITFVQGEYEMTLTEIISLDSVINIQTKVEEYVVNGTDLILDNTNFYYPAGDMPIYNELGELIGSVPSANSNTINITTLEHFTKRPAKFEIMSFVTPYGINLDLGIDGKSYVFDVTDFGPILKGKKRISMERGGQWQEDIDIKFLFVEGTPTRNVIDLQQVWPVTQENFTVIGNNETRFEPRTVTLPATAETVVLKAAISGHGQEGEFIPRTHYLDLDGGNNEFEFTVWKECSENPIHPQGGTWVYDRAGWCPGMATDINTFNVTDFVAAGDPVELDYGVNNATGDSRYIVNVQMVSYGEANFTLDAALADIITPTQKVEHGKFNPSCGKPLVLIKNNGTTPLTSLDISYYVDGLTPITYTWTGNLAFLETEEVELPSLDLATWSASTATFYAAVSNPNGEADEYAFNNERSSVFDIVPTLDEEVIIIMRTNAAANETSWKLLDSDGVVIRSRDGGLSPNTNYQDTISNLDGCYQLLIEDTDQDGISWWANNDGNGYVGVRGITQPFKFLEADFGGFLIYNFFTGVVTSTADVADNHFLKIYPNPSEDIFFVELEGYTETVQMELYNQIGQVLQTVTLDNANDFTQETFNLSDYSPGVYYLKINHAQVTEVRKLMRM